MKSTVSYILAFIVCLFFSCKEKTTSVQQPGIDKVAVALTSLTSYGVEHDKFAMIFTATHDSTLKLPIIIGAFDAQALVVAMEKTPHDAPLPLDLFEDLVKQSDFKIDEVVIDSVVDGIYKAGIYYTANQKHKVLRSRCCDAVTLSVKFECPIFITKSLLIKR